MPSTTRPGSEGPFRVSPRAAMRARDVSRDDVAEPDLPVADVPDVEAERQRIRRDLDQQATRSTGR